MNELRILAFDLGTTGLKIVTCDEKGNILKSINKPVETHQSDGIIFQKTSEWKKAFFAGLKEIGELDTVDVIIGTGQMEDLIKVYEDGETEEKVSLYSVAVTNTELVSDETMLKLSEKSPNNIDPFMPVIKVQNEILTDKPNFDKTEKYILGSKDFINYVLTGQNVTDHTNASTSGMFDYETLAWNEQLPEEIKKKLPVIMKPFEKIKIINKDTIRKFGFRDDVKVLNGIGDAGASTIGAGIQDEGESNIYMGTTGWITSLSNEICPDKKMFSLFGIDTWMIIGPVLNAGNAYDWARKNLLGDESYDAADEAINKYKNTDVVCHPYLNGERSPSISPEIRADISNISINSCKEEIFSAFARSICFSLKHVKREMNNDCKKPIILNGGIANSPAWCQMLCDVLNTEIHVSQNQQLGPITGLIDIVRKRFGLSPMKLEIKNIYRPDEETDFEKHFQAYLNSNNI